MVLNKRDARLMKAPSVYSDRCIFCGRPSTEQHHVVYRSHGGSNGPTVSVCGWGNTSGCHGALHSHTLHLDYDKQTRRWKYLKTDKPCSDFTADQMEGWRFIGRSPSPATTVMPFKPAKYKGELD